jgi:hypothetical protein
VDAGYLDFDDLWAPFAAGVAPSGAFCAGLDPVTRAALREALRARLDPPPGPFRLPARAWLVIGDRPTGAG